MVQRRNISYVTQTLEATKAWDTFMSLVATTLVYDCSLLDRYTPPYSLVVFFKNQI